MIMRISVAQLVEFDIDYGPKTAALAFVESDADSLKSFESRSGRPWRQKLP